MTVHRCPTCTCAEQVPIGSGIRDLKSCEVCSLNTSELTTSLGECYSCGLDVCDGASCSALVLYRVGSKRGRVRRWVRMCRTCVADRHAWGELAVLSPWAATFVLEERGTAVPDHLVVPGKGTSR